MGRSTHTGITAGVVALLLLAGCSIKNDVPDFRYPSRTDYNSDSWPKLAPTEALLQAGDKAVRDPQKLGDDNDRFASRVQRLRARAADLSRAE
jgi:outer membrane murein-binding lipoprotein Lpp